MKKIELLSPAGDLERLKVTLLYGADAVYLGGQDYSLRANANNFSLEEIEEACTFAHQLSKRVYLTLNIVFHEEDTEGVEDYIKKVVQAGIDAFIVSDPFLIHYIKENYPKVEVHLSAQNSTTNREAIFYFEKEGVDRVVLARELSREEIREIIDHTHMDIEVFIHGAMCTCYSGRCALSNYVTNRDANRGGCSQVCRFAFETEKGNQFTMASKDLNLSHYIKDMIDLGVTSLKVEGRMRSLYYLATVIGSYRRLIDAVYEDRWTAELIKREDEILSRVANREASSQFFLHEASMDDQYFTGRQEISNQDYLAMVLGYDEEHHCLTVVERNYFAVGDTVELFTPSGERFTWMMEPFYDEQMNPLEVARHPEQILKLPFSKKVPKYSMLRLLKKGAKDERANEEQLSAV